MAEAAKAAGREGTDYYATGASFADEINRTNERAAKVWMVISGFLALLLALALVALASLAPLKETELYAITVNETVGTISVARPLEAGPLREDEAVREALVAQYVIARETWEPYSSRDRFELAMLMSGSDAERSLAALWATENPNRPPAVFGVEGRVSVSISAIRFIQRDTANVRFTKTLILPGRAPQQVAFNAILGFRFIERRMSPEDLWRNPLGFEVTSYSTTEER